MDMVWLCIWQPVQFSINAQICATQAYLASRLLKQSLGTQLSRIHHGSCLLMHNNIEKLVNPLLVGINLPYHGLVMPMSTKGKILAMIISRTHHGPCLLLHSVDSCSILCQCACSRQSYLSGQEEAKHQISAGPTMAHIC